MTTAHLKPFSTRTITRRSRQRTWSRARCLTEFCSFFRTYMDLWISNCDYHPNTDYDRSDCQTGLILSEENIIHKVDVMHVNLHRPTAKSAAIVFRYPELSTRGPILRVDDWYPAALYIVLASVRASSRTNRVPCMKSLRRESLSGASHPLSSFPWPPPPRICSLIPANWPSQPLRLMSSSSSLRE